MLFGCSEKVGEMGAGLQALRPSSRRRKSSRATKTTMRELRIARPLQPQQVPSLFLCPIQLEVMRDPVTLHTGMTYDRGSIETWFDAGHNTCPVSNEALQHHDLIPNHTLRRAIQTWCVANPASGISPPPSPKPPVDPRALPPLLHSAAHRDHPDHAASLRELSTLAKESHLNRTRIKDAGAVPILTATLASDYNTAPPGCVVDAVAALTLLQPLLDSDDKRAIVADPQIDVAILALCSVLASGNARARVNAAVVLHTICKADPARMQGSDVGVTHPGAMKGLMTLLKADCVAPRAVSAGLRCLLSLCQPKRNRLVAIECRAVGLLLELLPQTDQRRNVEYCCAILEILANCAEGREAITEHPLGVTLIVNSLLTVSDQATENALGALWVVLSLASNRDVINVALRAGLSTKLLMVLPSDCSARAKAKAREMLKMLNGVWGSYTSRADFVEDSSVVINRQPDYSSSSVNLPARKPLFRGES